MPNIDETLAERGSRYGDFPDHAGVTQELKRSMNQHNGWNNLADDQKEALEMVAHKIGRIINGDPNYIDSWTDIIGYTRLVEKRLIDEQGAAAANQGFDFGKRDTGVPGVTGATERTEQRAQMDAIAKEIESKLEAIRKALNGEAGCDDPRCATCHPETAVEDPMLDLMQKIFGPDVRRRTE